MRKFLILAALVGLFAVQREALAQQNNPNDLPEALRYLKSNQSTDRAFALSVLGLLGNDAVTASKQVVKSYFDSDSEVRRAASLALETVNPPLYAPVQTLVSSNPNDPSLYGTQLQAIQKLSSLGTAGEAALPALLAFMPRMAAADQAKMVAAVAKIGASDPEARAALANWALNSSNPAVRAEALKLLPKVNGAANDIGTFLTALQRERNPKRRIEIIGGLADLGRGNQQVTRTLQGYLNDSNADVRKAAKAALDKMRGKKR
jgi:HEAT repeat protein